ncbi:hypothetical protein [Corynebacterium uterequi]|uniref:Membrane protein involved in the export of O-antigen and teichoic acid n=1 Tax=Corynebacterium uterequi TaxID=1072256 RepID=A0A0G3HGI8_9CORY|nr:hypothetical protein [Corynebacterium uterequi]AKK10237.1 hypothetical protein CUTER_01085 [Corynebacterium uterequi]
MKSLSAATIIAALSGFGVILVAGRAFDPAVVARFMAYWGLFFTLTGVLDGLTHETSRSVAAARERPAARTVPGPTAWRVSALLAGSAVVVVGAALAAWSRATNGVTLDVGASSLLVAGTSLYTFQALTLGMLAGRRSWRPYALIVALDSAARLLVACVAWRLGAGLAAFYLVTVMGAATWLVVLAVSTRARRAVRSPLDADARLLLRRSGHAMTASGASAVLIVGFPAFATVLAGSRTDPAVLGAVMLGVTLTRAPILVPLQRFQSALIVAFVRRRDPAALARPLGLVAAVGAAGAILAGAIGPQLMVWLLGEGYRLSGWVLAGLTVASACTGTLFLTGAACLAVEQHRAYSLGWVVATAAAAIVLAAPVAPVTVSVPVALSLGPLLGAGVHSWCAARAVQRP